MAQLASTTVFGELLVTAKSLLQGNVGIGTTSPSWKLHVSHSSGGDATYSGGILIENTSTTAGEPNIGFKNAGMGSNFWFVGPNQDTDMNFAYGTTHSDANTKMTITSGGNVGIGTTAPAYALDVSGDVRATGTFRGSLTGNASTATTLATARTINGTSFNGSANITTANWGTARTLTIGSTGKSVNGSANVSWSLAEIGAAPASHTHTASQVGLGNVQNYGIATQAQAQAGTANNVYMTPLRVAEAISSLAPSSHTHTWSEVTGKPSTFTPSSHSHGAGDLPSATTSAKGVVQLSSAVNSTSTTLAATASAVKSAYDLANSKWTYNEATIKAVKVNSAGKADTLATARTINGTSFNGSANITTANWGTARTLTIGSTGKSVNGSSNVSWTLAEIGAAPASHTHQATLTATLNTGGWTGTEAPFVQIQQVSGILATDVPIVDVVLSGDWGVDEARLEAWGYVYRIVTSNNSITAYAREKPEVALPLQLKVVR